MQQQGASANTITKPAHLQDGYLNIFENNLSFKELHLPDSSNNADWREGHTSPHTQNHGHCTHKKELFNVIIKLK